jgi:xanthine dehydrogenase accessory factor
MKNWLATLNEVLLSGTPTVRVVMANVRGSAPREAGATMLVSADRIEGTRGGGHLEWKAIGIARDMLARPELPTAHVDRFTLGATLGQCCGGVVELWFERYDTSAKGFVTDALAQSGHGSLMLTSLGQTSQRQLLGVEYLPEDLTLPAIFSETGIAMLRGADDAMLLVQRIYPMQDELWLFGAGHVGKALMKVLADLPLRITWVDSRDNIFPPQVEPGVTVLCTDDPAEAARNAPSEALFLMLTHSHDLDFDICRAILSRESFAWAGLIGSHTKATRFTRRLRNMGFSAESVARIVCPIGVPGINSKLPAALAIAVAAQLLTVIKSRSVMATPDLQTLTVSASA